MWYNLSVAGDHAHSKFMPKRIATEAQCYTPHGAGTASIDPTAFEFASKIMRSKIIPLLLSDGTRWYETTRARPVRLGVSAPGIADMRSKVLFVLPYSSGRRPDECQKGVLSTHHDELAKARTSVRQGATRRIGMAMCVPRPDCAKVRVYVSASRDVPKTRNASGQSGGHTLVYSALD